MRKHLVDGFIPLLGARVSDVQEVGTNRVSDFEQTLPQQIFVWEIGEAHWIVSVVIPPEIESS